MREDFSEAQITVLLAFSERRRYRLDRDVWAVAANKHIKALVRRGMLERVCVRPCHGDGSDLRSRGHHEKGFYLTHKGLVQVREIESERRSL